MKIIQKLFFGNFHSLLNLKHFHCYLNFERDTGLGLGRLNNLIELSWFLCFFTTRILFFTFSDIFVSTNFHSQNKALNPVNLK